MDMLDILHKAAASLPEPERWELQTALRLIGEGEPPEQALQLTNGHRRRIRDNALKDAAEAVKDADNLEQTANTLERAIRRFDCRIWPRVRYELNPNLPPIDAALFRAFRTGVRQVHCARKLRDIIE